MPFQCKSYSKRSYHHHLKNSLKRLKAYGDSKRQQSTVVILIAEQFTYGDTRPSINDQNFRFVHFMILILLFKYGGLQKKEEETMISFLCRTELGTICSVNVTLVKSTVSNI